MIKVKKENDEVLYPTEDIVHISKEDIQHLKTLAIKNPRKRVRLCAHETPNDSLHEMFIVHMKDCYVTPHKHLGKSESMAVIEGEVDIVLFNEDGSILRIVEMGDLNSGKLFYQRLSSPVYHTLIIRSEFLVFHEITEGPFLREKTAFAPWAPSENSPNVLQFIQELEMSIDKGNKYE
ncbi:WbuC family cupin fold metalloprotein [Leptospira sp. GIMC2001]|uniref:WbuC family cupin fold metalloprotein n=1 Tax=Leptospira sp. GIMC2001 TaxID=1513297 RepID=UPI00234AF399|nr:WbuC family cupin fold metalloprotein [Leptospira sp. GIMC2001]WCL51207.1 WbuC family cupin fold metalloprotein [Leptospira sp. GIMC2001]